MHANHALTNPRTGELVLHPLTGKPIYPIAHRTNGRPIWPIMGGSEDAGDAGGQGADTTNDSGAGDGSGNTDGDGTNGGDNAGETPEAKATRLEAEVAKLRRENAADRTSAKAKAAEEAKAELAQTIGKILGTVKDGDKAPTVDELTQQLAEQTKAANSSAAARRDAAAELVVWRNATELGIDATAVTDSVAFSKAIQDLDPSDDKFDESVKKAAQAAAENNPKLKATAQGAGSSSADHGRPGGGSSNTNKDATLESAVAGHYGS